MYVWSHPYYEYSISHPRIAIENAPARHFWDALWFSYFKVPLDNRPLDSFGAIDVVKAYFFSCQWHEVYNILEFILAHIYDDKVIDATNATLERELAAYRFVGGVFTDITDKQELEMLNAALADNDFPGVRQHLQRALELLSDRKNPDYRNSIKESISAVENLARIISGNDKATLGDALKEMEWSGKLHTALKAGFSALYGYTNDADGIRHAMLDEPNLTTADAMFFFLSCTSFINYLKSKMLAAEKPKGKGTSRVRRG